MSEVNRLRRRVERLEGVIRRLRRKRRRRRERREPVNQAPEGFISNASYGDRVYSVDDDLADEREIDDALED